MDYNVDDFYSKKFEITEFLETLENQNIMLPYSSKENLDIFLDTYERYFSLKREDIESDIGLEFMNSLDKYDFYNNFDNEHESRMEEFCDHIERYKKDIIKYCFFDFDNNGNDDELYFKSIYNFYIFFILNFGDNISTFLFGLCSNKYNNFSKMLLNILVNRDDIANDIQKNHFFENKLSLIKIYNFIKKDDFIDIASFKTLDEEPKRETIKKMILELANFIFTKDLFQITEFIACNNYIKAKPEFAENINIIIKNASDFSLVFETDKFLEMTSKYVKINLDEIVDTILELNEEDFILF